MKKSRGSQTANIIPARSPLFRKAVIFWCFLGVTLAAVPSAYSIFVKGPAATVFTPSIRHNDTLYIPVSPLLRAYGLKFTGKTGETFVFESDLIRLELTPGDPSIRLNGETVTMSAPADWAEGKFVVPIYLAIQILRNRLPETVPVAIPPGGRIKIVLDPGHGGRDPGAVGPGGLKEKDVVLRISGKVKDLLEMRGYSVYLTREGDSFVSLKERARMADLYRADLFVSIHANAAYNLQAQGTETFYYSESSGPWARKIARLENAVLRLEMDMKNGEDKPENKAGARIKFLGQVDESRKLALMVQKEMGDLGGTPDRGIKPAEFYVLKYTSMPAVLVETGFLSNHRESRQLADDRYLSSIAEAIARGIGSYLESGK